VWIRDELSYEQDYQPSQFFRRAFVRPVYAHPRKVHGPLIAPMPVRVIPQSMVGPGFLAHMMVSKYVQCRYRHWTYCTKPLRGNRELDLSLRSMMHGAF